LLQFLLFEDDLQPFGARRRFVGPLFLGFGSARGMQFLLFSVAFLVLFEFLNVEGFVVAELL
jgi:hypothetical protein